MTAETKPKLPWRTPRWRAIPARDAEMPVGKANPGTDGIGMS